MKDLKRFINEADEKGPQSVSKKIIKAAERYFDQPQRIYLACIRSRGSISLSGICARGKNGEMLAPKHSELRRLIENLDLPVKGGKIHAGHPGAGQAIIDISSEKAYLNATQREEIRVFAGLALGEASEVNFSDLGDEAAKLASTQEGKNIWIALDPKETADK